MKRMKRMKRTTYKTVIISSLLVALGFICAAATPAKSSARAEAFVAAQSAATINGPRRSASEMPFYLNDVQKNLDFPKAKNKQDSLDTLFNARLEKNSLPLDAAMRDKYLKAAHQRLLLIITSIDSLKSDCILSNEYANTVSYRKHFDNVDTMLESGLSILQNDCLRALSQISISVDRLALEQKSRDIYRTLSQSSRDQYNLMALDELEQAYLNYLYLAVTETQTAKRYEYYFSLATVGLKLWSFNKEDTALLPLMAFIYQTRNQNNHKIAWLMLEEHIQFSFSGSAGEHVPHDWKAMLITLRKI